MEGKKLLPAFFALFICTGAYAGQFGKDKYEISACAVYGFNTTWRHYGGAAVCGLMPINKYFEADAGITILSSGTFSCSVAARPRFPLPVGEIFLDGTIYYRSLYKYSASELVSAVSLGYRMDYVSVQAGIFSHSMISGEMVTEPFNFLYRFSFNVRPASSVWNIGGGITDYSLFEFERQWEPMFFLNGYYEVSPHLRINAEATVKVSGMFHLLASFYGIRTSLGLTYVF